MADEWWKLSQEELSQDSQGQIRQAKRLAYYNVFYATKAGRQVLLDLQHLCCSRSGNSDADLASIELLNLIRLNCGCNVESEKAAIDAEARAIT